MLIRVNLFISCASKEGAGMRRGRRKEGGQVSRGSGVPVYRSTGGEGYRAKEVPVREGYRYAGKIKN